MCTVPVFTSLDIYVSGHFLPINRSILSEMLGNKGVLKTFSKYTEKHLCQNLFFKALACNFIKKRDSSTCLFL